MDRKLPPMSPLGHKRRCAVQLGMSALCQKQKPLRSSRHFHSVDLDQFATAQPKTIFLCGNQFRERDNVEKKNVDRVSSCYPCDTTCRRCVCCQKKGYV